VLQAKEIVQIGGNLYACNPLLQHLRQQFPMKLKTA
jgi:hypothetical protein